jgi:hypothetical protein
MVAALLSGQTFSVHTSMSGRHEVGRHDCSKLCRLIHGSFKNTYIWPFLSNDRNRKRKGSYMKSNDVSLQRVQ